MTGSTGAGKGRWRGKLRCEVMVGNRVDVLGHGRGEGMTGRAAKVLFAKDTPALRHHSIMRPTRSPGAERELGGIDPEGLMHGSGYHTAPETGSIS